MTLGNAKVVPLKSLKKKVDSSSALESNTPKKVLDLKILDEPSFRRDLVISEDINSSFRSYREDRTKN